MRTSLVVGLFLLLACRGTMDPPDSPPPGVDAAGPADLGRSDLARRMDMLVTGDLGGTPMPPPATCNQRSAGKTAIQARLSIDKYRGLYTGGSGTHEDADATLLSTIWVYDSLLIDSDNISLAMLVDMGEGHGLPSEQPLVPGQIIEVEGEYISAATAGAKTDRGPAAVIHFTHSPCGFSVIAGSTYH